MDGVQWTAALARVCLDDSCCRNSWLGKVWLAFPSCTWVVSGTAVNKEWNEVWLHGYLEVGAEVHSWNLSQARKDGDGPEACFRNGLHCSMKREFVASSNASVGVGCKTLDLFLATIVTEGMEQGKALLQTPSAADEQQLRVGGQAEENVTHRKATGQ